MLDAAYNTFPQFAVYSASHNFFAFFLRCNVGFKSLRSVIKYSSFSKLASIAMSLRRFLALCSWNHMKQKLRREIAAPMVIRSMAKPVFRSSDPLKT
jgi:hypothetical protein